MCGRYVFFDSEDFTNRYMLDEGQLDYSANYNISPGSYAPVVSRNSPNTVKLMKWGLIPSWSKEFKMQFKTINARLETITSSPLYGPLLMKRRCLIPCNGFYEWTENNGKTPHFIHTTDQKTFSMAGLYDIWLDVEGKEFRTYTIITTKANALMSKIHHRMPVILRTKDEDTWLDHSITDKNKILRLLKQYSSEKMEEFEVSTAINSGKINSVDLIKPAN